MDVRHRPGAKLYLKHPHILDAWPAHRDSVYVRNKEVNLCLGTSDKWLCVARLPFNYTEEQLNGLMAPHGRIKHSFLICSEVTGESKGYGLVKYESQEAAAQAKQFVNGTLLEDEAIQVDWLNSSFIQYSQLHSKCLYVSNLPPNFRDLAQFRKIFSVVKNPPYCQVSNNTFKAMLDLSYKIATSWLIPSVIWKGCNNMIVLPRKSERPF